MKNTRPPIKRNPFVANPIRTNTLLPKPMHPIDREILIALSRTKLKTTPSQISKILGIHPATAQTRIKALSDKDFVKCTPKGNRNYCKINLPQVRKTFKKGFF